MRGSVKRRGDSWRGRYRDADGREHQRTFATRRLADEWVRSQLASISTGSWVDPSAGGLAFADYAADWLAAQHVRDSTKRLQAMRLRLYIEPVIGATPLRSVRRSHVVTIVAAMVDAGLSPNVIKYAVGTLRAVLDAAVRDRLVPTNVAADRSIVMPRRPRQAMSPLSVEEVAAIAEAIAPRYRALVLLGAASGLRSGELRGLTLDRITPALHVGALDVEPRQGLVRVDRQLVVGRVLAPCKTDSSVRDVSIGATTMGMLRDHVRAHGVGRDGFLFTGETGQPLDSSQLSVAWTKALRAAGVRSGVVVHDLRHHHASSLLSQGLSPAVVARRLGHANPGVTMSTYAHVMPNDDERALAISEAIAARLA